MNKTRIRYAKIKEFNSKKDISEDKEKSPEKQTNIKDMISQKIMDRREVLREIVEDYPETKKMILFNGFEPVQM